MKPDVLSYDEIDSLLDQFNPAVRDHDGVTFAIEIANAQRDDTYEKTRQDTAKEIIQLVKDYETINCEEFEKKYGWHDDFPELWEIIEEKFINGNTDNNELS